MRTKEEVKQFFEKLRKQEKELGITIDFHESDIRDNEHLNCIFYGDYIGGITYGEYSIDLFAYGDVSAYGKLNGEDFEWTDRNNTGLFYREFGDEINDEKFEKMCTNKDKNNWIEFDNNNWLEFGLCKDGEYFSDFWFVLDDDDVLNAFTDIPYLLSYVDEFISDNDIE